MKPTLNEQLTRMQKLAGIIKENQTESLFKSLFKDKKFKGLSPYSKEEVKSYLNVDDDYEDWVELAFTNGFKLDEFEDQWYGPLKENKESYYKDAEKDDAAHIDALEKDMKDDAKHTSEGKMTKSDLKAKIKEMILAELNEDSDEDINITDADSAYDPLAEAKKDKEEEVEDVTIDDTKTLEDTTDMPDAGSSNDIPNIQSHLQSAYAEAKQLGDEKLITQIANTITYFTKAHVLDTAPVNESMFPMLKKIIK
jgi:ribosomal protein S20